MVSATIRAQDHKYVYPKITCIDAKLPLNLIDVDYRKNHSTPPLVVADKVKHVLSDFYEELGGDQSERRTTVRSSYIGTVRVPFNKVNLYIVVMKTPDMGYSHSRLFLYDPHSDKVSKNAVDFNIWATYNCNHHGLTPALKQEFHIATPDLRTFGPRDHQYLTVSRISHNGSFSALETTTYAQKGVELDTMSTQAEDVNLPHKK